MRFKARFAPLAATLAFEPREIERGRALTPVSAPAGWTDVRVEAWLDWAESQAPSSPMPSTTPSTAGPRD